jgi:hypothetical protein
VNCKKEFISNYFLLSTVVRQPSKARPLPWLPDYPTDIKKNSRQALATFKRMQIERISK